MKLFSWLQLDYNKQLPYAEYPADKFCLVDLLSGI